MRPKIDPKGDIVFQAIQWEGMDYEDAEEEVQSYLIKAYGVNREGATVSVNITGYTPFFFIKINRVLNRYEIFRFRDTMSLKFREQFVDVKMMSKKDFWGFHNNQSFMFLRFTFRTISAFRQAIKYFSKPVAILSKMPYRYQLYESNIEPILRFMHIRNILPADWISITNYDINTGLYPTRCQIDISCKWTNIEPFHLEMIAPLTVASFDIECSSSHGDFPVARKNYKKVAYELLEYYGKHVDDFDFMRNIVNEIVSIFDEKSPGVLSKVFTKNKLLDVRKVVQSNIDEIIAILKGNLRNAAADFKQMSRDNILKSLTSKFGDYNEQQQWEGIFPPLQGDGIIQIGTTVHTYGSTECHFKHIVTLGTCDKIDGVEVEECETERELLLKWRDVIRKIDPDIMTGYNIFGFDMMYMYQRAQENGIQNQFLEIGRVHATRSPYVEKFLTTSALGDNLFRYIDIQGVVLIDLMKQVQRDHKLDSYKLDAVASHFLKMRKNDVHPSEIFALQKGSAADRKRIAQYCIQDCALCNRLLMKLETVANNIGMANVCSVPLQYIFMRGQSIKIFSLIARQCREENHLIPTVTPKNKELLEDEEDSYEGAIVLDPQEGIYLNDPVCVLDYASLYPSSMISENLSHDSIVLNPKYDNIPGVEYLDITFDVFEKTNGKKVKTGVQTCRFVQTTEKGILPRILLKLLKQRKDTRKKMEWQTITLNDDSTYTGMVKDKEDTVTIVCQDGSSHTVPKTDIKNISDTYDDFQKAVLDGLQLAYKITANSLYGACGAKTSQIYMKEIAACTTATGRKMILLAKEFLEQKYRATTVYGDTDSVFVVFPTGKTGKAAILPSIEMAKAASHEFKKTIKAPHDLEYEKVFYPLILLSKKRYVANKYEHDDEHFKQNSMGIVMKRRDNAPIVKHVYGGILNIILNDQDLNRSVTFLKDNLNDLVAGKFPLEELVITKSLKADYKNPEAIAHKVLAERMGVRDPGNKPQVNDRIPFVYIQTPGKSKKVLQGDRIEHPDYIRKASLQPDYEFYITNQIMKPVSQLYALALEQLHNYKKGDTHFTEMKRKLLKEYDDPKKAIDKWHDAREEEVKTLLFDPILVQLQLKRNGYKDIMSYFPKA